MEAAWTDSHTFVEMLRSIELLFELVWSYHWLFVWHKVERIIFPNAGGEQ